MNDSVHIHKQSWKAAVFTHGRWYMLSSVLVKGINFFLLPVYTRYLSTSEYGVLNVLLSVNQFFTIIVSLYIDAAFAKFFHNAKRSEEELRRLFSSVFWFLCVYGGCVVAIGLATMRFWLHSIAAVPLLYGIFALVPALFTQIGQLGIVFLRQSLLARETTVVEVSSVLAGAAVTIPLLVWGHLGVLARLLGITAAGLFLVVFYTAYFRGRKLLVMQVDRRTLMMCLAYCLPLLPNLFGSWLAGYSDRIIIARYADTASVGIYSLSFQIGFLLYAVQDAITQVTSPIVVSGLTHDRAATKARMSNLIVGLFGVISAAHLGLAACARELVLLLGGAKFAGSVSIVAVISYNYVIVAMYRTFSDVLIVHGKSLTMSAAGVIMGAATLALNLLLVPRYGYSACAWNFPAATLIYLAVIFVNAQRADKIEIHWRAIAGIFAVTIAGSVFFHLQDRHSLSIGSVALKGGAFAAAACCIFLIIKRYAGDMLASLRRA